MARMYMTVGLPGSGKTTGTDKLVEAGAVRLGLDHFRLMLFGGWTGDDRHEAIVVTAQRAAVEALLRAGCDVVVDDLNLDEAYTVPLVGIADAVGAAVVVDASYMLVPVDECVRRDAGRERSLGEAVIRELAARYGIA